MSRYYKVDAVKERGKRLAHYPQNEYPTGKFQNRLVAICDKLVYKVAADVTMPEEYKGMYGQYAQGWYVSFDLYDFVPQDGDRSS